MATQATGKEGSCLSMEETGDGEAVPRKQDIRWQPLYEHMSQEARKLLG